MKLIKADHNRGLEIPGVPGLARRPVDIDRSRTGFANLHSLRIYRFDAQSVINGHAEEDEVFVVVLAGSVELSVSEADSAGGSRSFTLSAASSSYREACVAYLPPHSAYRLTPRTDADVAYARATPVGGRPAAAFTPSARKSADGATVLLEEATYAQRLRLRLTEIDASQGDVAFTPVQESDSSWEALVHVRTVPAEGVASIVTPGAGPTRLDSWDTVAVEPGEHPTLRIAMRSSAFVLVVLAA
jgi:hypothetical protein